MLKTLYTCDQCGAEKKETNHWFALRRKAETVAENGKVYTFLQPEMCLEIHYFDYAYAHDQHICGQACLIQAVSEFASRSVSASPAPTAHLGAARTAPVLSSEDA